MNKQKKILTNLKNNDIEIVLQDNVLGVQLKDSVFSQGFSSLAKRVHQLTDGVYFFLHDGNPFNIVFTEPYEFEMSWSNFLLGAYQKIASLMFKSVIKNFDDTKMEVKPKKFLYENQYINVDFQFKNMSMIFNDSGLNFQFNYVEDFDEEILNPQAVIEVLQDEWLKFDYFKPLVTVRLKVLKDSTIVKDAIVEIYNSHISIDEKEEMAIYLSSLRGYDVKEIISQKLSDKFRSITDEIVDPNAIVYLPEEIKKNIQVYKFIPHGKIRLKRFIEIIQQMPSLEPLLFETLQTIKKESK